MGILDMWKRSTSFDYEEDETEDSVQSDDGDENSQTTDSYTKAVTEKVFNEYIFHQDYTPLNKHPDILIAVDKIADLVSNMTIQIMENTDKGDKRIKDALSRKLDVEPCRHMTRKTWLYKIVRDLLLDGDGNSVVHIEYDVKNLLIENLTPLDMSCVTYESDQNDYVIHYGNMTYTPDEVVHFVLNPNPHRYWEGMGYRVALRDIANNLSQATKTKNNFMKNKHLPSLIVKVDALTEEFQTPEGRRAIANRYIETTNTGEPWIVPSEMIEVDKITPLTLKDIAINEAVEIDKKTVAGLLGVPAFFLGVGKFDKDEFNTFINTRIMSIAMIISQTLTRDILVSPSRYIKLNPRSLYAYNLNDLVSAGGEMVRLSAMRRNELRDWVGMAPDDEMDELIVLENYLPQDRLGDQKKLGKEEKKDGNT